MPALFRVLASLVITLPAYTSDFRPTFTSEVVAPATRILLPLLRVVCGDGVRTVNAKGQPAVGCGDGSMEEILASRHRQRQYPWMPYALWEADSVLFGHFLSGASEDVLIGCTGCEGHPALFGGTLLLTKKSGEWTPVWYKPGVIVRHCRRVPLAKTHALCAATASMNPLAVPFEVISEIRAVARRPSHTSGAFCANRPEEPVRSPIKTKSIRM